MLLAGVVLDSWLAKVRPDGASGPQEIVTDFLRAELFAGRPDRNAGLTYDKDILTIGLEFLPAG